MKRKYREKSRDVRNKTRELKNLDHDHKYRDILNKNVVSIIGGSILSGIDERGLSNKYFKVRVKNHPGATTEDVCDHLKLEIRKKPDVVIIHAGADDLTNYWKIMSV